LLLVPDSWKELFIHQVIAPVLDNARRSEDDDDLTITARIRGLMRDFLALVDREEAAIALAEHHYKRWAIGDVTDWMRGRSIDSGRRGYGLVTKMPAAR
jgi:hypothetical protein